MLDIIFKIFFDIFLQRKPEVVCYRIGDNLYTCDAYWK